MRWRRDMDTKFEQGSSTRTINGCENENRMTQSRFGITTTDLDGALKKKTINTSNSGQSTPSLRTYKSQAANQAVSRQIVLAALSSRCSTANLRRLRTTFRLPLIVGKLWSLICQIALRLTSF